MRQSGVYMNIIIFDNLGVRQTGCRWIGIAQKTFKLSHIVTAILPDTGLAFSEDTFKSTSNGQLRALNCRSRKF